MDHQQLISKRGREKRNKTKHTKKKFLQTTKKRNKTYFFGTESAASSTINDYLSGSDHKSTGGLCCDGISRPLRVGNQTILTQHGLRRRNTGFNTVKHTVKHTVLHPRKNRCGMVPLLKHKPASRRRPAVFGGRLKPTCLWSTNVTRSTQWFEACKENKISSIYSILPTLFIVHGSILILLISSFSFHWICCLSTCPSQRRNMTSPGSS